MASADKGKTRVFFIPFFASGHMIPMVDLACLFAARPHVEPTLMLTPANAALVRPTLDRSYSAGRPVKLLLYPFPDVGLPPGIENLSSAPSSEAWRVYRAVELSRDIHDELLHLHRPDAVVADVPFWWTTAIAADIGIPRITFHAVGVFPQLAMNNLFNIRPQIQRGDLHWITVPDFPGPPIELPCSELPGFLLGDDHLSALWNQIKEAQLGGHGVVVNTFYELEPTYCELFRRVDAKRAWFVGPVALASYGCCTNNDAAVERGSCAVTQDKNRCLQWLDSRERGSVVFVCFGSWCHFQAAQLREVAAGLEASGRPFLWVVRESEGCEVSVKEEWMPEGWEERVAERGMVVLGWAPQVAILGHAAVGAFLSHCGWNSLLEAVTAGVPLLTWPLVFEQFINERLMVEVVGAGKRVWDGFRSTVKEEKVVVPGEAIGRAVSRFMEAGGEGEALRRKARELAAAAKAAVEEGGSSHRDLNNLIDEIVATRRERVSVAV